jgi:hypothetical protein
MKARRGGGVDENSAALMLQYSQKLPSGRTIVNKVDAPIYQVKVGLLHIKPLIWRRFLVSSATKLSDFHGILQIVMGWTDSHLHMFKLGRVSFSYPFDEEHLMELTAIDSTKVKLYNIIPHMRPWQGKFRAVMRYDYDFGDNWRHKIIFEDVMPRERGQKVPWCLEGARACPPEDIGSYPGYQAMLEALNDPQHPEHEMYANYSPYSDDEEGDFTPFDPEAFDLKAVNDKLSRFKTYTPGMFAEW